MAESLPDGSEWVIVFDADDSSGCPPSLRGREGVTVAHVRGGRDGNAQRNLALSLVTREFVYYLDDDNIVHPSFATTFRAHASPERALVVNQVHADGTRRLKARPPILVGGIDTAQVVLPRAMATERKWFVTAPFADGIYFSQIYDAHGARFVFLDEDAAYYNFLDPMHGRTGSGERV
jgi:hypothetical protein